LKATTSCGGYKLAIINKMLWSQVVQRLVHQDSELEFYLLTNWQPVELSHSQVNQVSKQRSLSVTISGMDDRL